MPAPALVFDPPSIAVAQHHGQTTVTQVTLTNVGLVSAFNVQLTQNIPGGGFDVLMPLNTISEIKPGQSVVIPLKIEDHSPSCQLGGITATGGYTCASGDPGTTSASISVVEFVGEVLPAVEQVLDMCEVALGGLVSPFGMVNFSDEAPCDCAKLIAMAVDPPGTTLNAGGGPLSGTQIFTYTATFENNSKPLCPVSYTAKFTPDPGVVGNLGTITNITTLPPDGGQQISKLTFKSGLVAGSGTLVFSGLDTQSIKPISVSAPISIQNDQCTRITPRLNTPGLFVGGLTCTYACGSGRCIKTVGGITPMSADFLCNPVTLMSFACNKQ